MTADLKRVSFILIFNFSLDLTEEITKKVRDCLVLTSVAVFNFQHVVDIK